jgi:hypothetical protein
MIRKTFTICTAIVALAGVLSPVASADADAVGLAEQWLRSKGWRQGWDRKSERLVILTHAAVAVSPTQRDGKPNPQYIEARHVAFDSAMSKARAEAVKFMAGAIKAAVEHRTEFTEVRGAPEVAKSLVGLASNQAFKLTKDFNSLVEVGAELAVAGVYVSQSFESVAADGAAVVALIACVSPASAEAACVGLHRPGGCTAPEVADWFSSIPDDALARTFGVRLVQDASCTFIPVSFGQRQIGEVGEGGSELAIDLAQEIANDRLATVMGESLSSRTVRESIARFVEEGGGTPNEFRTVEKYQALVRAAIAGQPPGVRIGQRKVMDPASGQELIVVATLPSRFERGDSPATGGKSSATPRRRNCPPIPSEMSDSVRQVQCSGVGSTKAKAIEGALLEAIRREGALVEGNSLLERRFHEAMTSVGDELREKAVSHQTDLNATVKTFANGFVYSYEVTNETQDDGHWDVSICANLVRFDPKNPRFGLPPTVAVLFEVSSSDAAQEAGQPISESLLNGLLSRGETAFRRFFLARRSSFCLIGAEERSRLERIRDRIREQVADRRMKVVEALKLDHELSEDFILVCNLERAEFTGEAGARPQRIEAGELATATIRADLLNVANGEIVWSDTATVTLMGRDILLVRAGQSVQDPDERSLRPIELAVSRALRQLVASLQSGLPATRAQKSKDAGVPAASAPQTAGSARIVRVANSIVTLDAANPGVVVGARFVINLLVDIDLGGGRVEVDRDRVGTIEVVSIDGGLAKARVVEGDATAIDPKRCEAVLATK